MQTIIRAALALAAVIFAAGCATPAHQYDAAVVDAFEPGITTLVQVTALLGPHASESQFVDGARLLRWKFDAARPAGLPDVAILFDRDGRMMGSVYRSN